MDLVIVESPTKAKTLRNFLGSGYRVEATMGHVRDLPEKKIGMEINGGVKMEYVVISGRKETVKLLKKIAEESGRVILATDPDREGEAIAWHVASLLGKAGGGRVFERIEFHEITQGAIQEAFKKPRGVDMKLVDAQQARRALDRLVGYKLSPLLGNKVRRGLSAGRVQSVALRLIVEREREREKFQPKEYWWVRVLLGKQTGTQEFWASLVRKEGKKYQVSRGDEAERVVADLERSEYGVRAVEKKESKRTPPPPFTTSTLQQTASSKLGWTAKRTMAIAQQLYEAGLITYHRTDSTNLAGEATLSAARVIGDRFGKEYVLSKPRFYKTKSKVAQEAHEAIRPTDASKSQIDHEGSRLYEMIWKRFICSQMAEAVIDVTKVDVEAVSAGGAYGFEARGEVVKFDGWLKVYGGERVGKITDVGGEAGGEDFQNLPDLAGGERVLRRQLSHEQKFTQPRPRFTEATLIKSLEELGIGRPSTYAPIISRIVEKRYVEREERKFRPSTLGVAVNDFLVGNFSNVMDYQFTAKMEDELDEIAMGKMEWSQVIKDFYEPFSAQLLTVAKNAERVAVRTEATGEKCPECKDGDIVIRLGKFGKFLSCSRFPECKYKTNYVQKVDGVKCPRDSGDIIVKKTRTGKSFYGCSNYPGCEFASWTKPK